MSDCRPPAPGAVAPEFGRRVRRRARGPRPDVAQPNNRDQQVPKLHIDVVASIEVSHRGVQLAVTDPSVLDSGELAVAMEAQHQPVELGLALGWAWPRKAARSSRTKLTERRLTTWIFANVLDKAGAWVVGSGADGAGDRLPQTAVID